MRKKINYIYIFLIISVVFLITGTYLTVDAYLGMHSIEIASSQIEFIKNLPFCIEDGQKKKIPLYKENYFLKKYPFIKGFVSAFTYEDKISVKRINVTLKRPLFTKTELNCLIDARSRN
jgi:hypothetical protein